MSSAAQPKFDESTETAFGPSHGKGSEVTSARAMARLGDIAVENRESLSVVGRAGGMIDLHGDLLAVERTWRAFEQFADCTVFQTFEWLSTWQRHIGVHEGARPLMMVVRDAGGEILCMLPLAVTARRYGKVLSFLGSDLCDYNAPLLAPDFACRVPEPLPLLRRVFATLQARIGYDVVAFEKMPETVGAQANPLIKLPVMLHPSGAYMTHLGADWEEFYCGKRSTSTRQRDRAKRKKLTQFGEVRLVHPTRADDILATLETLMAQKGRALARMGVANMFAKPGYRDFYRALATDPATQPFTDVSRLQVGNEMAAVNLGLTFRDRYYYVLASYGNGEMARFGPGAAHLRDLMQYAIGRGIRIFDFTVGDESYKREWCAESLLYDHIAGVGARGVVAAAGLLAARALKRHIKRNPTLWKMAYRMRERLGRLRGHEVA